MDLSENDSEEGETIPPLRKLVTLKLKNERRKERASEK